MHNILDSVLDAGHILYMIFAAQRIAHSLDILAVNHGVAVRVLRSRYLFIS